MIVSGQPTLYLHEDTPGNGPLLEGYDTSTDLLRRDLGLVDWDDGRGDTNAKTANNTSSAEHADILRSRHEDGAEDPEHARDLERDLTGVAIRQER